MQSRGEGKSPGELKKLKALKCKKRWSVVIQEVCNSRRGKTGEARGQDGHKAKQLGDQDTGGCKG